MEVSQATAEPKPVKPPVPVVLNVHKATTENDDQPRQGESSQNVFMEKCFKMVVNHLDFMDRLLLETVNNDWRQAVSYDDIRAFRLSNLSSWSAEDALSRWCYESVGSGSSSAGEEWCALEGNALHRILNCILSRCKNLVSLTFSSCEGSTSDEKVKIVITTETIRLLKTLSPQIQCLDVSSCGITDDALLKLMKKYKRTLMELNLNDCILLPTGILSLSQLDRSLDDALRKMRQLRRLNPSVSDFDALRLPETGLQCFTSLELTSKSILADDQLSRLWCESGHSSVYNLESLVLSDNNFIRRFDIISHLQSLRRMVLQRLPRLNDDDLQQIFHWCQKLVDVELVDCRRVRLRFRWPSALRRLRLIDPAVFDSQNLVSIGAQCSNLRSFELKMKNLHTNGPDANSYSLFAKLCSRLRRVSIDVITLPESILFQFLIHCKDLTTFSCKQMTVDQLATSQAELGAVSGGKMLRLKTLSLYNMEIDFHLFMEMIDRCDRLTNLHLRQISFNCQSRDDSFCAVLWKLGSRCLRLRNLVLADCGDSSVESISSFYDSRRRQLKASSAVHVKSTKFIYRNVSKKLTANNDEFTDKMKQVGVDFVQEHGVDYTRRQGYTYGDSFHDVAFC